MKKPMSRFGKRGDVTTTILSGAEPSKIRKRPEHEVDVVPTYTLPSFLASDALKVYASSAGGTYSSSTSAISQLSDIQAELLKDLYDKTREGNANFYHEDIDLTPRKTANIVLEKMFKVSEAVSVDTSWHGGLGEYRMSAYAFPFPVKFGSWDRALTPMCRTLRIVMLGSNMQGWPLFNFRVPIAIKVSYPVSDPLIDHATMAIASTSRYKELVRTLRETTGRNSHEDVNKLALLTLRDFACDVEVAIGLHPAAKGMVSDNILDAVFHTAVKQLERGKLSNIMPTVTPSLLDIMDLITVAHSRSHFDTTLSDSALYNLKRLSRLPRRVKLVGGAKSTLNSLLLTDAIESVDYARRTPNRIELVFEGTAMFGGSIEPMTDDAGFNAGSYDAYKAQMALKLPSGTEAEIEW